MRTSLLMGMKTMKDIIDSNSLDIDQSGTTSAYGDGIMIFRHLTTTFPGQALINNVIDPNSPYYPSNWNEVANNINSLMI